MSEKQAKALRHKQGWRCVECDRVTGAVNDAGEPQCLTCQRELRNATNRSVAKCGCGEPMLSDAAMCGFCEAELVGVGAGS